jgi:hypothetical protein
VDEGHEMNMSLSEAAVWRSAEAAGVVPAVPAVAASDLPAAFGRALERWNAEGPRPCGHPSPVFVAELSESSVLCVQCAAVHAAEVRPRCACCGREGRELRSGAVSGLWHGYDVLLSFAVCVECLNEPKEGN